MGAILCMFGVFVGTSNQPMRYTVAHEHKRSAQTHRLRNSNPQTSPRSPHRKENGSDRARSERLTGRACQAQKDTEDERRSPRKDRSSTEEALGRTEEVGGKLMEKPYANMQRMRGRIRPIAEQAGICERLSNLHGKPRRESSQGRRTGTVAQ